VRGALAAVLALLTLAGCREAPRPAAPARSPAGGQDAPARRPNIVVVVLDDLDAASLHALPGVTARLADQGLVFERHFVANPLCAPSRASLLTGLYPHNHGVLSNGLPDGGFARYRERGHEGTDVAARLHAAGYRTALLGKYLNDYPHGAGESYVPPGWDDWHAVLEDRRADNFGYWVNDNGRVSRPDEYQTDFLARRALEFVRDPRRRRDQPFFLYLAPAAPHAPSTPAPRHLTLFTGARAPRTPAFDEADVSDKPAWLQAQPRLAPRQIRRLDRFHRRRLQSLAAVDEMTARLLGALDESGELARTYVWFTSDNGYVQGQHRFPGGKNAPYEEAVRVPLLVRGPGVPAGGTRGHLVSNIDYAATFLEIAGTRTSAPLDGRSLLPLLRERPPSPDGWRDALLVERERSGDPFFIPAYKALRTANAAYIEYATGAVEYYDLERDPHQLDNAARGLAPEALRRLHERLRALAACCGASCR
jgi:arylsulfatase A-like enzyme